MTGVNAPKLVLLPAVDVVNGQAVRLVQGEAGSETSYGDPLENALAWQEAGAEWVHLVDLDVGFGFGDIPEPDLEGVLEDVVQEFGGRDDVPPLCLTVPLPDGRRREWDLRGTTEKRVPVDGEPAAVLGWLLGRTGGEGLRGDLPELPVWV